MSYTDITELPSEVRRAFEVEDQEVWMNAYNSFVDNSPEGCTAFEARTAAWEECKYLPSSRYVCANVSTEVVDITGEVLDVEAYVETGQEFAKDGGALTINHSNKIAGTVWKIEEGIDPDTEVPCILAHMNYFRGLPLYDSLWNEFKRGRREFSIASHKITAEKECNTERCYLRLKPEQWYELSNVDRGINPITYPVEINESAKGSIVEVHDDVCPLKEKYLDFKGKMEEQGLLTHYGDFLPGMILIEGALTEETTALVFENNAESRLFPINIECEEGGCSDYAITLPPTAPTGKLFPHGEFTFDLLLTLIRDEEEAIAGYIKVLDTLDEEYDLSYEVREKVSAIFEEIMSDEKNHIGSILEVLRLLDEDYYDKVIDGVFEAKKVTGDAVNLDSEKSDCPAGQHDHAGVTGCHDIFRRHHTETKTQPTDRLDLTDEDIDVTQIENISTERLREILKNVANVLSRYSDAEVQEFLSTTQGKEFVLGFLEYKKRTSVRSDIMEENEKGTMPDVLSSISNIASSLSAITAVLDQMNIRLMGMERDQYTGGGATGDISGAILEEMKSPLDSEAQETDGSDGLIPPEGGEEAEEEDKGETPAFGGESEGEGEGTKEGEDAKEGEGAGDGEDAKEGGDAEEGESEESKSEEDSKEEDDSEPEEKAPDSKKDEPESEDEEEDKEKGSVDEGIEEDEDKEDASMKGTAEGEVKDVEIEIVVEGGGEESEKGSEDAIEETVKVEESEDSLKGEDKEEELEEGGIVVEGGEKGVPEPVAEEPVLTHEEQSQIDFRAAVLKRQAELREKGVVYHVADVGEQNSLATLPVESVKGTGVSLVPPSEEAVAFDVEKGIAAEPDTPESVWGLMGTIDNKTLLRKILGE